MGVRRHLPSLLLIGLAAASCSSGGSRVAPDPRDPVIAEVWQTAASPQDDLDSLAVWHGPAGERWVIGTGKATHRLAVHDLETGALVRHVGGPGSGPGQLSRPNGVAVAGDLAFVVERDNRRVQAFRLPGFEPAGTFGEAELRKPYGLAVLDRGEGRLEVWITDDYPAPHEDHPEPARLGERLRSYEVDTSGAQVAARLLETAGATSGPGALLKVESIEADPEQRLLLVADERGRSLDVYGLDGAFTGRQVQGLFAADPEGIVLVRCPGGTGYWVTTEQRMDRTRFHVLDRKTLEPVGVFSGERTGNTDGIALTQQPSPRFPHGALLAVHDDQGVAAFDWRDVVRTLGLRADCGGSF
jgi:3-phytase